MLLCGDTKHAESNVSVVNLMSVCVRISSLLYVNWCCPGYRCGWGTSPSGISTRMSCTVVLETTSNCGCPHWRKSSTYLIRWNSIVCLVCGIYLQYRGHMSKFDKYEYWHLHYRSSRKTFDTSETAKEIGPIVVQFGKVRFKHVNHALSVLYCEKCKHTML